MTGQFDLIVIGPCRVRPIRLRMSLVRLIFVPHSAWFRRTWMTSSNLSSLSSTWNPKYKWSSDLTQRSKTNQGFLYIMHLQNSNTHKYKRQKREMVEWDAGSTIYKFSLYCKVFWKAIPWLTTNVFNRLYQRLHWVLITGWRYCLSTWSRPLVSSWKKRNQMKLRNQWQPLPLFIPTNVLY